MSLFDLAAAVVVCAAAFGYINHHLFGMRPTTALTMMGAAASIMTVLIDQLFPRFELAHTATAILHRIDFPRTLFEGLLSFLLFAGGLHIDLSELQRSRAAVTLITISGVLISTGLIAVLAWLLLAWAENPIPFVWCLVFGALISPTDPVAVLGILKSTHVPKSLEVTIGGESLFNDGLGVVIFIIALDLATGTTEPTIGRTAELFLVEALGGAVLGALAGWMAFMALRTINEHNLEVLITLALVMGTYALAHLLDTSGPIATAVAGLIIGNQGRALAMSANTRDHVTKFWSLIDEMLNAVLFLLIGLEIVVVIPQWQLLVLGIAAVPLTLFARAASVGAPFILSSPTRRLPRGAFTMLVIGGVRGGISIALALSIPEGPHKATIVMATYVVVLFSVLVQSSSAGAVAERLFPNRKAMR